MPGTDDTLRLVTALVGALACGLLLWRLLATWLDTTVLVHVLGGLLVVSVLLGAVASSLNNANGAPANPVLWLILLHRLLCILVAVMWPVWCDRKRPPYRRPLTA